MRLLVLFATPSFVGITVLTLRLYAVFGGPIMLLPYMLISTFGYSAGAAGAAVLPFSPVRRHAVAGDGGLATRIGLRTVLTAGPVAAAVRFVLLRAPNETA